MKHICSQGTLQRVISWNRKTCVCNSSGDTKALEPKFFIFTSFQQSCCQEFTCTHSQTESLAVFQMPSCNVIFPLPLSLFANLVGNHNAILDMWLLWHRACYRLNTPFAYRHVNATAMSSPFKSPSWMILNFPAPFLICCKTLINKRMVWAQVIKIGYICPQAQQAAEEGRGRGSEWVKQEMTENSNREEKQRQWNRKGEAAGWWKGS